MEKRLTVACDLIRFFQTVGRDLTAANIRWNQVMSNFEIQWKALKNRKVTEFRQPIQVQSHLEMPGILVQLGHIQRT